MAGFLSGLFGGKSKEKREATPPAVKSEKVKPEKVKSEKVKPEKVKPEKVKPEQVKPEQARLAKAKAEKVQAYFLADDDARSMGDIDYMRTARKTRRTFPKTLGGAGLAFEQEVSSMNPQKSSTKGTIAQPTFEAATSFQATSTGAAPKPVTERRRADSSLDLFRKMAKDIRK